MCYCGFCLSLAKLDGMWLNLKCDWNKQLQNKCHILFPCTRAHRYSHISIRYGLQPINEGLQPMRRPYMSVVLCFVFVSCVSWCLHRSLHMTRRAQVWSCSSHVPVPCLSVCAWNKWLRDLILCWFGFVNELDVSRGRATQCPKCLIPNVLSVMQPIKVQLR